MSTARLLAAIFFIAAGTGHFVIPAFYLAMMPPWLPAHVLLVQLSGIAEIIGGVGLLIPRFRQAAGVGLIVLLIAVFPANIEMLLKARAVGAPELGLWIRLRDWPWLFAGVGLQLLATGAVEIINVVGGTQPEQDVARALQHSSSTGRLLGAECSTEIITKPNSVRTVSASSENSHGKISGELCIGRKDL